MKQESKIKSGTNTEAANIEVKHMKPKTNKPFAALPLCLLILQLLSVLPALAETPARPSQVNSSEFKIQPLGSYHKIPNEELQKLRLQKQNSGQGFLEGFDSSASVNSVAGGNSGGGGDAYVIDFVRVASQEVYPWLTANGDKLVPMVDSTAFLMSVNPKEMASVDHVYESCQVNVINLGLPNQQLSSIPEGSTDREVGACFNSRSGMIYIGRSLYPLQASSSPGKKQLIAHEIFRKMNLPEGDAYSISKQIKVDLERHIVSCSVFIDQNNSVVPNYGRNEVQADAADAIISSLSKGLERRGYSVVNNPSIAAYFLTHRTTCTNSSAFDPLVCGFSNTGVKLINTISGVSQIGFGANSSSSIWDERYETYMTSTEKALKQIKYCK